MGGASLTSMWSCDLAPAQYKSGVIVYSYIPTISDIETDGSEFPGYPYQNKSLRPIVLHETLSPKYDDDDYNDNCNDDNKEEEEEEKEDKHQQHF